jgi:drug/metabolite transporter (DMT)-like permease
MRWRAPSAMGRSSATSCLRGPSLLFGFLFCVLASIAYGITPALVKTGYASDLNQWFLIVVRSTVGAVVLLAVSRLSRSRVAVSRTAVLRCFTVGALLFAPQIWLFFAAIARLDTALATVLVYIYPAAVTLFSACRGRERVRPVTGVVLVVASAGLLCVLLPSMQTTGVDRSGLLMALVCGLGYAAYVIVGYRVTGPLPALIASAWVLIGTATSTLAVAVALGQFQGPSAPAGWSFLAVQGLLIVPVGIGAFLAGLRRLGPTRAALVDTLQPVVAVLVGVVVLGEMLTPGRWFGTALVLAAVALAPWAGGAAESQEAAGPAQATGSPPRADPERPVHA